MGKDNFVESTIPLHAIKSAVALQHSHDNKALLDSLTSDGSDVKYLGADGQYHDFPSMFFADAFVNGYNQTDGNVTAYLDADGKLYLKATNTFAKNTNGRVIGTIEVENEASSSGKQLNVSIAEVDVNSGDITENDIHYILVGTGLSIDFNNSVISISLDADEAPFSGFIKKQTGVAEGTVGVFGADGSVVGGGVKLSDLVTAAVLQQHVQNTDLHVTKELQDAWSAKQNALSEAQLTAVNSGITAVKVQTYDGYATQKLNVGGHGVNKAVVTDSLGNITTEDKFDPATKINTVPTAVQNRVAIFTAGGQLKDSGIILGDFSSAQTVREYIDNAVNQAVSGSSYQGTFTLFGTRTQIESYPSKDGDTAIAYIGTLDNLGGLLRGDYDGTTWTFDNVTPMPTNGAWMEADLLLTETPPVAGRVIVRMDGVHDPGLDVRPQSNIVLDNQTIGYNSSGAVSFKMRTLASGKSVLNSTSADSLAYEFTTDESGTDTTKTVKEVIDAQNTAFEPKFSKNTAFNKDFDTSSQSGTSTKVIGDKDTRLTNSRPASDVYPWAKASTKPTYTAAEVGALPNRDVTANATQNSTALFTSGGAYTLKSGLDTSISNLQTALSNCVTLDGTQTITGAKTFSGVTKFGSNITITPSSGLISGTNVTVTSKTRRTTAATMFVVFGDGGQLYYRNVADMKSDLGITSDINTAIAGVNSKITPYVCCIKTSSVTAPTSMPAFTWTGSAGNYSCTIPFSSHGKGAIVLGSTTYYFPRVITYSPVTDNSTTANYEETYDSPAVTKANGGVTVYSNVNTLLYVLIY